MQERDDEVAAVEASMYRNALKHGKNMDAATRIEFEAKRLSAEGQLASMQKPAEETPAEIADSPTVQRMKAKLKNWDKQ